MSYDRAIRYAVFFLRGRFRNGPAGDFLEGRNFFQIQIRRISDKGVILNSSFFLACFFTLSFGLCNISRTNTWQARNLRVAINWVWENWGGCNEGGAPSYWVPSRESTYPTLGKGKSSTQNAILGGYDMLVPARVHNLGVVPLPRMRDPRGKLRFGDLKLFHVILVVTVQGSWIL